MSLLDILTGMLGAFLFLMLGLLPYYAKVSKSKESPEDIQALRNQVQQQRQEIASLEKQVQDLQKLIQDAGGGPLTAQQVQQLLDQLNQLRGQLRQAQDQIQELRGQNDQLSNQLAQAKQNQRIIESERDYWQSQNGTIGIVTTWDSPASDIDVFILDPDGGVRSSKPNQKLFGKNCYYDGDDSHGTNYSSSTEGVITFITNKGKDGDYLVFYRVPETAVPATYANLKGWFLFQEMLGRGKGGAVQENGLGNSQAAWAQPGGLYAWAVLHYDSKKSFVTLKPLQGFKLPASVVIPQPPPPRVVPPARAPRNPSPAPAQSR